MAGILTPDCQADPVRGAEINLIGTLHAFEAARRHGIRPVIYTSSAGVFGPHDGAAPAPTTHYGTFKLATEGSARAYWADHGLPSVGFRPFVVYGPGRETGLSAGPSLACRAAARGQPYVIPFTGATGMVYVEDVAAAYVAALTGKLDGARVFNLLGRPRHHGRHRHRDPPPGACGPGQRGRTAAADRRRHRAPTISRRRCPAWSRHRWPTASRRPSLTTRQPD